MGTYLWSENLGETVGNIKKGYFISRVGEQDRVGLKSWSLPSETGDLTGLTPLSSLSFHPEYLQIKPFILSTHSTLFAVKSHSRLYQAQSENMHTRHTGQGGVAGS